MGAASIVVENDQYLRRAAMSPEGMGNHGGEFRRLTGLDDDGPFPQ